MVSNKDVVPDDATAQKASQAPVPTPAQLETDDFGLPIRRYIAPTNDATLPKPDVGVGNVTTTSETADKVNNQTRDPDSPTPEPELKDQKPSTSSAGSKDSNRAAESGSESDDAPFVDAQSAMFATPSIASTSKPAVLTSRAQAQTAEPEKDVEEKHHISMSTPAAGPDETAARGTQTPKPESEKADPVANGTKSSVPDEKQAEETATRSEQTDENPKISHTRDVSAVSIGSGPQPGLSEFSHQQLSTQHQDEKEEDDGGWQTMPAFAPYDIYDDDNRLIAREHNEEDDEKYGYSGLGGAGKGYTRVIMDEDAESATSLDDNTQYLFQESRKGTGLADDEGRDAVAQMQATKDLLTEGQRIAYVGVVRLEIAKMVKEAEDLEVTKKIKRLVNMSAESEKMWGQKMMIRLYSHMDISEAEQVMIEQLAEHGVMPKDLTPALHANSRVHNPMAEDRTSVDRSTRSISKSPGPPTPNDEKPAEMPPPYESIDHSEVPDAQTPSQLPTTEKIDIDLRWTVLCDLFLILIADSIYDARSRVLLERVADSLEISWIDICKFEKRVTDALEMQQAAEKENWNEDQHMESRRKQAQKRRYMMMGLATVGGGLVIGLSAGLLAPVIGAGLAAGFTTIGVTGTSSFLAGAGGAAIITSSAAASGSLIGGRAANRRTGAVKTFEYRPLHNNKRVNLIVTVSGWLTGKVDDVRLPFSTVDSVMGDIYSVLWEPEMLRSMGDTINILATEALTQGLQQILGSTILMSLMAALQLPIVLTKLSYLIDNPWAVSLDRATAAGLILADSLMDRSLGTRPITLVGYSLGARVIFSCLQELAKRGAYGLVQNIYLFGSPIVFKKEEFIRARTVVSGRFVNGYNRNDWILGYLFRLTNGGIRRVAGLAPVEAPWVENIDVTEEVPGHMQYRTAMPTLLIKCGWIVESEEFTEIEDPDPDNHEERQRELINEIEEARKELEREGKAKKGSRFSLFGRRKKADRQEWEVYEESAAKGGKEDSNSGKVEDKIGNNHGVLFDVDAIRAELAKESHGDTDVGTALQVKEIESTLPPMKLDFSPTTPSLSSPIADGRSSLRETRSADILTVGTMGFGSPHGSRDLSPYHTNMHEEEVQMTFDTSFDDSAHTHTQAASSTNGESRLTRPEMKSSQTLPNMTISDPWADPEHEDFGKEKEISMTYA
ncbi:DUF726 domain protein [Metarhizium acridum CQMa 102]|uniref:DUF726 domain protein n=1 Tax=Metarhizium acridum (strain CQMa 102) TaxID=655827 RepID=E9E1K0_METAQ|nr:DUF726 domain protein [Metarhizium acridum CQMa 102]EFY90233.1 DUF726 domain protein [Metarhizium acridum CQMa 102]